jgi:hypothetical protein
VTQDEASKGLGRQGEAAKIHEFLGDDFYIPEMKPKGDDGSCLANERSVLMVHIPSPVGVEQEVAVKSGLLTKCSKLLVEGNETEDIILDNMLAGECDFSEDQASQ